MSRLYVIVGLIGSGKTALAKKMACKYIDFDKEWHVDVQQELHRRQNRPTSENMITEAVHIMADLARKADGDAVIDGWWTWLPDWWTEEDNRTLGLLQSRSGKVVQLIYLHMSAPRAVEAYKHSKKCAGPPEEYNRTINARTEYLLRKVSEWEK